MILIDEVKQIQTEVESALQTLRIPPSLRDDAHQEAWRIALEGHDVKHELKQWLKAEQHYKKVMGL